MNRTCLLEEKVELGMGVRVQRDFKQRHKDVVQQLLKVVDDAGGLVHIIQPRQLHHPGHIPYEDRAASLAGIKCKIMSTLEMSGPSSLIDVSRLVLTWILLNHIFL